jgi:hypothetical protein
MALRKSIEKNNGVRVVQKKLIKKQQADMVTSQIDTDEYLLEKVQVLEERNNKIISFYQKIIELTNKCVGETMADREKKLISIRRYICRRYDVPVTIYANRERYTSA